MAENKRSFLLYTDVYFTVKKLTDVQAGKLFKHILSYVNDENPELNDLLLDIAFEPIKQSLKRDLRKYEAIIERNKINGSKGGRPKTRSKKPKKPSGLIGNPKNPVGADSDSDIDSGIDNDKEIKEVVSFFNETHFAKVSKLTDSRKKHLRSRIKEYNYTGVIDMIQRADKSDFLHGMNDRQWKADFDWLMNPNNYVKVIEGKFDNKKTRLA